MITDSEKYFSLRREARLQTYQDTIQNIPELTGRLRLTDINPDAIAAQLTWPQPEDDNRQIGWNWNQTLRDYRRNHRSRIELAIWYDETLCGLMLGKASRGKLVVKINYLQGLPNNHPLKKVILPVATRYAELFAVAIEAMWIGIQDPIDQEDLLAYYRELGFDQADPFDPRNRAIFRRVDV